MQCASTHGARQYIIPRPSPTRELRHARLGPLQERLHGGALPVDEVEVLPREAAGVEHADGLLHHHRHLGVALEHHLSRGCNMSCVLVELGDLYMRGV